MSAVPDFFAERRRAGASEGGAKPRNRDDAPLLMKAAGKGDDVVCARAGDAKRDVLPFAEKIRIRAAEIQQLPGGVHL